MAELTYLLRRAAPWCLLLFLIASFFSGKAQNAAGHAQHKIDSIQSLLETYKGDTTRVNLLVKLAREMYRTGRYDAEVSYATDALELARKLGFGKGQADALTTLGHVAMRKGLYDSAVATFQSAANLYSASGKYRGLANVLLFIGQVNDYQARYNEALQYYNNALTLIESWPDESIKFKILNSTGVTNFNKGSYEAALQYYLRALKVSEGLNEKLYYASVLNNIGVVNMSIHQYDEALEYFQRYLATVRSIGTTQFIAVAKLNVGEAMMRKQDYAGAIIYLDSALINYREVTEKRGMSLSHSNLGECYKQMNEFERANAHYVSAIQIAETIGSDEALLRALVGAAELGLASGRLEVSAKYLDKARLIAGTAGAASWLERSYLFSSKLDSARGNYAGAYEWFKLHTALKDSLFNERKSQQVVQMRELYESEKKDKEIRLLSEGKKIEQLRASANQRLLLISILFFILVIGGFLWWLYVKSRHSAALMEQNVRINDAYRELKTLVEKVEDQNVNLAQKNEALEDLYREKDGLIGIVAHDLRAPLNRITGLAQILSMNEHMSHDDREIIRTMEKVCRDGNRLIQDLLEINEYENSSLENLTSIDLVEHVRGMIVQYETVLQRKKLRLVIQHDAEAPVFTNVSYIDRILDNIVTNAIKFSPSGQTINVSIRRTDHNIEVIVRDQGPGFHPDDMPHLFRKFKKLSARPTAGEASTGLGLSIVKTLTEKIGGTIRIESEWGRGAAVIIALPLDRVASRMAVA